MIVIFFFVFRDVDKNQYVHRRDSVSVSSLSEQEIQRRVQLGFITPSLGGNAATAAAAAVIDPKQSEEWQDITDQEEEEVMQESTDGHLADDPTETESSMEDNTNPYLLDTRRRSSIDLGHLSFNRHDESMNGSSTNNNIGTEIASVVDSINQHHSNKRLRYRQPSIASISEEEQQLPTTANSHNNNNDSSSSGNNNILMGNDEDEEDEVATVDGNDEDTMEDI